MENKLAWLAISLFYEKSGWHSLMQEALKPFLLSKEYTAGATLYSLTFNDERGDNIRLNIRAHVSKADALLMKCQSHFSTYFQSHPIPRPKERWIPGDHFFLPFPAGSIQYGVYRTPKLMDENIEDSHKFGMRLSDGLLEAFDEPVTTDSMLIVAVLLALSAAKTISDITGAPEPIDEPAYWQYRKMKGSPIYSEQPETKEVFYKIIDDNRSVLSTMRDQIFCESEDSNEIPEWVNKWKSDCAEEFPRRLARNIPAYQTYFELSNLICQQMGYDDKFQNLVDFVVCATVKEGPIHRFVKS